MKATCLLLIILCIAYVGALGAPILTSPANGATGVSCRPSLKWSKVSGVTEYNLQVSKSSTFAVKVVDTGLNTTSYTFTTSLSANTTYYWRVRARLYSDVSPWSTAYFTTGSCDGGGGGGELPAPNLISPVNNTTWTQSLYPAFLWQIVTGASSYTIQISRSSTDFTGSNLIKQATVYSTNYITDTALTNCTNHYWRVRAEANGVVGSWSSVWKFTVQAAPSQPVLTSPTDGRTLTVRRPTFTWEASSGATAYTVEIDGTTYSVSTTSFTPYSDLSLGSHIWRVRATSCGGSQVSDWSPQRSFTIDLNDVVLKSPLNGAIIADATPTFEWYAVDGATRYRLEVRKDTIDGQKIFEVEPTQTSFTPIAILNPGTYVWHVMSFRNGAWTGSWSTQPYIFTIQTGENLIAPQLSAPPNGSTVDFPLTLQWSSVFGAYSYTLEYDRSISFSDATSVKLFGTNYVINTTLEEGRWYWHVKANISQGGSGPWSVTWSFEVGLPIPQLFSPANGASQGTSAVYFDWSDVIGSQIGGELYDLDHYTLQYSWSSEFESQNTITIDQKGGLPLRDSHYGPINLGDGTYYWRVKAIYIKYPDGTLREGSWSPTSGFSISTGAPPAKVQLNSPPNRFENTPSRPTFSWMQVQGATSYHLQVDNNLNFSTPEIDADYISATFYMATSDMDPDTYYWRVNSNAPNAEWSDIWSFTISEEIPEQVKLLSPTSGAQDMPPTPIFQWAVLEGSVSYTLEVSTNTAFTDLVVNRSGLTTTSWGTASDWENNDPSQLEDGTCYWRVSSDLPDSTSTIWNFTVQKPPSGETLNLTVTVSNLNEDPIPGAMVTLTRDGSTAGSASTDASGRAVINDLESGTYTLEVSATGYSSYSEPLNLFASTTRDITLYKGAVIHGYVYYDTTQNPAPNVMVRIYDSQTQTKVGSDMTDANGYFIVDNIASTKRYYITVENYEDQKKQGFVAVDTPTDANAVTVIIKTEGEIIGVVGDEEGAPLVGAIVKLRDVQGQFLDSETTTNIGVFTFKATSGQYYVEITLTGYEDYKGNLFTVECRKVEDLGLIILTSKIGYLAIKVQNEDGDLLDAIVTVKDIAGNVIYTISVKAGNALARIRVGTYTLIVSEEGYQTQTVGSISIESGTEVAQNFVLIPTGISAKESERSIFSRIKDFWYAHKTEITATASLVAIFTGIPRLIAILMRREKFSWKDMVSIIANFVSFIVSLLLGIETRK